MAFEVVEMLANQVLLEWVLVDGRVRHIGDFVGVAAADRPKAWCPECGHKVIMRLGDKRVPHAAHGEGADCPISVGESALHANAKFHLAAVLERTQRLDIRARCPGPDGDGSCATTYPITGWAAGWDNVEVEHSLGTARPDIVLMQAGRPIAAIEVFVHHAVDAEKSQIFRSQSLPWLEVAARQVIGHQGHVTVKWEGAGPLHVRFYGPLRNWMCPSCNAAVPRTPKHPEPASSNSARIGCRSEPTVPSGDDAMGHHPDVQAPMPAMPLAIEPAELLDLAQSQLRLSWDSGLCPIGYRIGARRPVGETHRHDFAIIAMYKNRRYRAGRYSLVVNEFEPEDLPTDGHESLRSAADKQLIQLGMTAFNPGLTPWREFHPGASPTGDDALEAWFAQLELPQWWTRAQATQPDRCRPLEFVDIARNLVAAALHTELGQLPFAHTLNSPARVSHIESNPRNGTEFGGNGQ